MADYRHASLVMSLLTLAAVGLVQAEEPLTQRDQRGAVTVAVTLITPKTAAEPIKAKVVLDTDSVALDAIALDQAVTLRTNGGDLAAVALEQASGGGHHREAVLVFPPLAQPGRVRIVVKNVGGIPERAFDWELPAAP